jgi:hypothetical protein
MRSLVRLVAGRRSASARARSPRSRSSVAASALALSSLASSSLALSSLALSSLALSSLLPSPLAAQDTASTVVREVAGRVVRPAPPGEGDADGFGPLAGAWVILHRVGPDAQGPIDSTRSGTDGDYRFRYRLSGSSEALYFVSASYGGIAYFTAPLRAPRVTGTEAEIVVYDTTSAPFPLTVRGRHLVVSTADSVGDRTIVEIFELSNDSVRTRIAGEEASTPSWSIAVPPGALDVRAGEGDIPPDAFAYAPGRVSVYAPVTPGLKQFSFSYRLPGTAFPFAYAMEGGAVVLEVLLEDQVSDASGAGLVETDPVAIEGRRFRRLLAQDVRDGDVVTLDAPPPSLSWSGLYVTILLGGVGIVMLMTLLRAVMRRKRPLGYDVPRVGGTAEPEPLTADRLAREIADLDAAFAKAASPSDDVRRAYEKRRAELKAALTDVLAEGQAAR